MDGDPAGPQKDTSKPLKKISQPIGGELLDSYSSKYSNGQKFQIYVKTLIGRTHTVEVSFQDSIANIKEGLSHTCNIPVGSMMLLWAGKPLEDGRLVEEYNIQKGKGWYWISNPQSWAF